jgi:hypothetical protein
LSSFWFVIKQKLTTKEISIFSSSSHLEWRAGLSNTILKGDHPRTIPARFGVIWFSGFRGKYLNVKVYDVWTTTDAKWWQKLTWPKKLQKKPNLFYTINILSKWFFLIVFFNVLFYFRSWVKNFSFIDMF